MSRHTGHAYCGQKRTTEEKPESRAKQQTTPAPHVEEDHPLAIFDAGFSGEPKPTTPPANVERSPLPAQESGLQPWEREPDPCWSCGGKAEARDDIHVRCIDTKNIDCEVMNHFYTRKTWNTRASDASTRAVDCVCGCNGNVHREDKKTGAARECTRCDCEQFYNVHMALKAAQADASKKPLPTEYLCIDPQGKIDEVHLQLCARCQEAVSVGYARGLSDAQAMAQSWANSPTCSEPHEDDPCCHRRTGAGIADAIGRLISQHSPQNQESQLRQLIIDAEKPHGTCYWGLGFMFSPATMKEDCSACAAKRRMKSIANGQDTKSSEASHNNNAAVESSVQCETESESSISSKLDEIDERQNGIYAVGQMLKDLKTLRSIIDGLQAELAEWESHREGLIEAITTAENAAESAASNIKAEIVKRVREKADHHNQDCITRMLRSLHSTCHCPATAFAELATELESVEVKDDPGR